MPCHLTIGKTSRLVHGPRELGLDRLDDLWVGDSRAQDVSPGLC